MSSPLNWTKCAANSPNNYKPNTILLFVYGTLKTDYVNHCLLQELKAKLISKTAILKDRFVVRKNRYYKYPYLIELLNENEELLYGNQKLEIEGEIFEIDVSVLWKLDLIEKEYNRKYLDIKYKTEQGFFMEDKAYVYVIREDHNLRYDMLRLITNEYSISCHQTESFIFT